MTGGLANIDIALLESEWAASTEQGDTDCPVCGGYKPGGHGVPELQRHGDACAMDLALTERGFPTQAEREAARDRIRSGTAETMPPLSGETP
jgi:hypothetical protein